MTKDKGESTPGKKTDDFEIVKISNFAAKLGEETGGKYQVYVYRVVKDEDSGRYKKSFVHKYINTEPDPAEIAQRFRGGQYLLQFIWYKDGEQQSHGETMDVDGDIFPPLPKEDNALIKYSGNSNLSENMQLQLAFISSVSEVLKAAYASGGNQKIVQQDPLDAFGGMLAMMETTFKKAMTMQSTIYERVFMKGLEDKYGLADGGAVPVDGGEGSGLVGQYAPLIREIVDGLKTVVGLFGTVPPDVVQRVKKEPRFQELLKNKDALVVIGAALRKQFGDEEARKHMRAFGVEMVFKKPQSGLQIARTPEIGGGGSKNAPGSGQRAPGQGSGPGQGSPGKIIPGAFKGQGKGKGVKVAR